MPAFRIGPLVVLAALGTGAGSRVFRVRRAKDGLEYALKLVDARAEGGRKYFEQARHEFRVGRMFDHPSLVKMHACEVERDWLFRARQARLLVEFAPGQPLDRLPQLPPAELVQVFAQVADGLAHMHERGVFHADLKPGNLVYAGNGRVKVIDFGLARVAGEAAGRFRGTPRYMAPETAESGTINERTDVYNLGATMYRLASHRPLPSATPGVVLDERAYEARIPPVERANPDLPPEVADLIHQCIRFDPRNRPARARDVLAVLRKLTDRRKGTDPKDKR